MVLINKSLTNVNTLVQFDGYIAPLQKQIDSFKECSSNIQNQLDNLQS